MTKWYLLLAAILCEVTGSLSLKGALDEPTLYVVVAAGFVAAFAFLTAVLRRGMPIGVAYGVWAALGVALTSVLSAVLYDEPFTGLMAAGIALIMGGVLLVELGSHSRTTTHGAA
ncbi:DMT family transporter [Nocardioides terrigena]|uniref:DMT family transporter n=1 Tax=Nocardioides terrigena TaxID=424797 RepID=UPI000D2FE925|nr:SMR family transporter [Nocardioides terrigena]